MIRSRGHKKQPPQRRGFHLLRGIFCRDPFISLGIFLTFLGIVMLTWRDKKEEYWDSFAYDDDDDEDDPELQAGGVVLVAVGPLLILIGTICHFAVSEKEEDDKKVVKPRIRVSTTYKAIMKELKPKDKDGFEHEPSLVNLDCD